MDPKDIRIAELEAALTQIPCTSSDCQESNPCEVHIALTNWPIDPKCTSCVGTCIDQWATNPFGGPTDCLACGATGKRSEQERRIRAVFNPANDAKTCAQLRSEIEGNSIEAELCGEEIEDVK